MSLSPENSQRWYDQDPALSRALASLKNASDKHQAQVALNIIKVVVEHQIEAKGGILPPEGMAEGLLSDGMLKTAHPGQNPNHRRRWYDVNETLASAMALLRDCPDDLQQQIIPTLSAMIEGTLHQQI